MAYILTSDNLEDLREELNRILRKIEDELNIARGLSGDIPMEARVIHSADTIYTTAKRGPVLLEDTTPQKYWRLFIDDGTISAETIDPDFKG